MERRPLLPRHLLVLVMPIAFAFLGVMLLMGNLSQLLAPKTSNQISQAQLFLAISSLSGALAFSWFYLPKPFTWSMALFLPVLFAIQVYRQLGGALSFTIISILNIAFAVGLMFIIKFTFFARSITRIRTSFFALLASVLLTAYFKTIYFLMKLPSPTGLFINALFLFVFIGFGLSLANMINVRKDIAEKRLQTPIEQEPEDTDDDL